ALVPLTQEDLERFNFKKGDTEGLVNLALSVEGVRVAILMAEKDGRVKMSFRSLGTIPVNVFAKEHFEGGGHANAAGGITSLSVDEAVLKIKSLIPTYFEKLHV
ncbi:MAG: phosphoesterase RecJ-like protein, partial [Crocinitomicaceae bacterium]